MVFPRLAALSEVAWTNVERKNYDHFLEVLKTHTILYQNKKIYFYDLFNNKNPEPKVETNPKKYIDNPK